MHAIRHGLDSGKLNLGGFLRGPMKPGPVGKCAESDMFTIFRNLEIACPKIPISQFLELHISEQSGFLEIRIFRQPGNPM